MKDTEPLYCVAGGFVTKEWARLFLYNWNKTVRMWNGGELFTGIEGAGKSINQQEYARLCCTWMLPNGFKEPHVVAEGG